MESDLPSELSQAESLLEEHKRKKQEVSSLINYTADEGEKIVVRVRQTVTICINVKSEIFNVLCFISRENVEKLNACHETSFLRGL